MGTNLLVPPSPKQTSANRKMEYFGKCFIMFKYTTVIIQTSKQSKLLSTLISSGLTCSSLTNKTRSGYTSQFQEVHLPANKCMAVPTLAFQPTDCSDWTYGSTSALAQCFLLVRPSVHPQMEYSHMPALVALKDLTTLHWSSGSLGSTALGTIPALSYILPHCQGGLTDSILRSSSWDTDSWYTAFALPTSHG